MLWACSRDARMRAANEGAALSSAPLAHQALQPLDGPVEGFVAEFEYFGGQQPVDFSELFGFGIRCWEEYLLHVIARNFFTIWTKIRNSRFAAIEKNDEIRVSRICGIDVGN